MKDMMSSSGAQCVVCGNAAPTLLRISGPGDPSQQQHSSAPSGKILYVGLEGGQPGPSVFGTPLQCGPHI